MPLSGNRWVYTAERHSDPVRHISTWNDDNLDIYTSYSYPQVLQHGKRHTHGYRMLDC